MDRNLVALKPALVWKHFAEIVRIPRPSSHEEKIRRYILDFARAQGLESKEDAAHNVYVRKPASKGMEDRKGVILQAHLDMVPQKNNDKEFDFTKDPIDAYIDGGWVTADGTTLGADNGIGVAPEHIPHLFDRFYRIDAGRSRKAGGAGLGLPIVKSTVQSLGGSVSVHTRSTGGLEIVFTLRKAPQKASEAPKDTKPEPEPEKE